MVANLSRRRARTVSSAPARLKTGLEVNQEWLTKAKLMTPMASKTLGRMKVNLSESAPIISGETREPSMSTEQTMTSMPSRAADGRNTMSRSVRCNCCTGRERGVTHRLRMLLTALRCRDGGRGDKTRSRWRGR